MSGHYCILARYRHGDTVEDTVGEENVISPKVLGMQFKTISILCHVHQPGKKVIYSVGIGYLVGKNTIVNRWDI